MSGGLVACTLMEPVKQIVFFYFGDQSSEGKTGSLSGIPTIYQRWFTDEMKQKTVRVDFTLEGGSGTCRPLKEFPGDPICPSNDLSGQLRLRERMCSHELHAEPRRSNGHGREFNQIRKHTTVETQGRRDPAHPLGA